MTVGLIADFAHESAGLVTQNDAALLSFTGAMMMPISMYKFGVGLVGIINRNNPDKSGMLLVFGIIGLGMAILSAVLSLPAILSAGIFIAFPAPFVFFSVMLSAALSICFMLGAGMNNASLPATRGAPPRIHSRMTCGIIPSP